MSVRTLRLFILSVCSTLLLVLAVGGCSRCGSACTPQGPWQSPTIQATRALLVVNTEELRILRMDGRNVHPSCIGTDGVREYHVPAGMHTVTATFRYAAPVSGGLIGAVHGTPVTIRHQFVAGHEYVPVYREHPRGKPEVKYLVEAVAAVIATPDRYWSLAIAALAQAGPDPAPEVREARHYCNRIRGLAAATSMGEPAPTY